MPARVRDEWNVAAPPAWHAARPECERPRASRAPCDRSWMQLLAAHREILDPVAIHAHTDAWGVARNWNQAVRVHGPFRRDDVPVPVTRAGREIAGKGEVRQRCQRDIVRTTDSTLEHSTAPH